MFVGEALCPWVTNSARPLPSRPLGPLGEVDTWTVLAREAIVSDPLQALRQMSFIITQLAETIAEQAGGDWSVSTVLQHLALDADEDGGEELN